MRCAVITVVWPQLTGAGGKIAAYGVAASLHRADFEVRVFYCADSKKDLPENQQSALNITACIAEDGGKTQLAEKLHGFQPDIAWIYTTRSWEVFEASGSGCPAVLLAGDPRDRIEEFRFKWKAKANATNPLTRWRARWDLRKRVAQIRQQEAMALQKAHERGVAAAYGPGDISYIRNNAQVPVDLCELSFPDMEKALRNPHAQDFLLLGNFTTVHTRYGLEYFFRKIWPKWKKSSLTRKSTIRVIGAGKLPPNLKIPNDCLGLHFVGFAKDLMEEFSRARAILVAVPISIGFRTRVIEAWARGVPVIMDKASADGLPEVADHINCLVANSPADWLNCAQKLLNDQELANSLGQGGRNTFERYYWCEHEAAIKRYRELSLKAIAKQTSVL